MIYHGNPVSPGIAIGPTLIYRPFVTEVTQGVIAEADVPLHLQRYDEARLRAKTELERIVERMQSDAPDKALIFQAHVEILFDVAMDEEIRSGIGECCTTEWAIHQVYHQYMELLGAVDEAVIQERVADLRDVGQRLQRCLLQLPEKNLAVLEQPVIIVANDLLPSDTATLDRSKVLAIVAEMGGATSHTAIIAKSYEIPAVLGVTGIVAELRDGETLIVDGVHGAIIRNPSDDLLEQYQRSRAEFAVRAAEVKRYLTHESVTADGVAVEIDLNIGSATPQELEGSRYTDGVGLFRSEFLYMDRSQLPTEEEQFQIYRRVLTEFGSRPVTLRTLDIGADKTLAYLSMPHEDNPFLGNRALRLCFANPELFKTQLRAAYRASVYGNLWIMFPMVGSLDDIRRAKAMVQEVQAELTTEGIPYNAQVKLGVMIEIPALAVIADLVAAEVDFASLGTNDLCQYLTAVDRLNPDVAPYYQSYHPAMFRLIGGAVAAFNRAGKPIGVCGEMGGDPLAAAVLIGLGIRKLSMGMAAVAKIKKLVTSLTCPQFQEIAAQIATLHLAGEIETYLKQRLAEVL